MEELSQASRAAHSMGRIVHSTIVGVTLVLFIASTFHALLGNRDVAVILALGAPLGISAWGFARAGHHQAATLLLCGMLVALVTVIRVRNPLGMHDVAVASYVGVTFLAAVLLEARAFAGLFAFLVAAAGAAFAADLLGHSGSRVTAFSGWPQLVNLLLTLGVFAWVGRRIAAHLLGGLGEARHASLNDPVSGLPNRAGFLGEGAARLAQARALGQGGVLVIMDLDHFRRTNLVIGREAADRLLAEVARRARAAGADHLVGRIGDDEFAVLATGVPELRAQHFAADVHDELNFDFQGVEVRASGGYARFPRDADDIDGLLMAATSGVANMKAHERGGLALPADRI